MAGVEWFRGQMIGPILINESMKMRPGFLYDEELRKLSGCINLTGEYYSIFAHLLNCIAEKSYCKIGY